MQIIAGKFKGRRLKHPKQRELRPTQQRVKEALFSIIQAALPGAKFLDLCCGSGGIGIEALSRGAGRVVFVDLDIRLVKENLRGVEGNADVHRRDVVKYLQKTSDQFDIVFLDPPWNDTSLYEAALKAIFEFDILAQAAWLICEHRSNQDVSKWLPGHPVFYRYGDTKLTVYKT